MDKTVRIWDIKRRNQVKELKGHFNNVNSVSFSSDGNRVVSGSDDRTIRIWDAETGEEQEELKGHTGYITSVSFSPDSKRVVSGSFDKTVRIWEVDPHKCSSSIDVE